MPSFEEIKRAGYGRHRQASQGAAITLVCGVGEYTALFECAKRISTVLGTRDLDDLGDGLCESIPQYKIPFEAMPAAISRLTEKFTVALVDMAGERFVLIHRIPCRNTLRREAEVKEEAELTIDDI